MDLLTEMRMPTRSAPRPPVVDGLSNGQRSSTPSNLWSSASSNDLFGSSLKVPQKKKPPPRPPPPKFPPKYNQTQEKPKKPARPTELLSNLFGRRVSKPQSTASGPTIGSSIGRQQQLPTSAPKPSSEASVCLIDLSPPGSPTFTTRSSSDGVSVDSFGSDGNSNPSAFASGSSGSASQTESAFEDDFDFFGGLAAAKKQQAASVVVDPWRVSCSQDPFGSFDPPNSKSAFTAQQQWPVTSGSQVREIGESSFFAFNDVTSTASSSASGSPFDSPSKPSFKMPTIIRPRKPRKDEEVKPKPAPYTSSASSNNYASAPRPPGFMQARLNENASQLGKQQQPASLTDWPDDEEPSSPSPPMPKLPPPPPPPEYIAGLEDGLVENSERPYGIALYDFPASQSDDLELKEGDLVYLTKIINDSWMEGRVGCREGMFPINFVDVKIPLPGLETNVVTALYSFKAETADDLSFEDGARIKVLSRVSDDWLYGEYQGKKGQFPANFVDKIPNDLPNHL